MHLLKLYICQWTGVYCGYHTWVDIITELLQSDHIEDWHSAPVPAEGAEPGDLVPRPGPGLRAGQLQVAPLEQGDQHLASQ